MSFFSFDAQLIFLPTASRICRNRIWTDFLTTQQPTSDNQSHHPQGHHGCTPAHDIPHEMAVAHPGTIWHGNAFPSIIPFFVRSLSTNKFFIFL
jgi:hypothetical protein